MSADRWRRIAGGADVREGEVRVFAVEGERIAVCRTGAGLHAVEDACTHDDGPLGEGRVEGFVIECPRHGARFDVRDGAVLRMPAVCPLRTFPVRVRDGEVEVDLGGGA